MLIQLKLRSVCRDLTFGMGRLCDVLGAVTNRMNVYMVAKASHHLSKNFPKNKWLIAVSIDSRIKSDLFAQVVTSVFAVNGIHVSIYKELMPTPCLSYAVRALGCIADV